MTDVSPNSGSAASISNQEVARGDLATWLRHARERSGLSIEAVSQETRISKNYILSLESGNLEGLPGKVFGRGFIKNITRLLRTDTIEGLRLYDACWGSAVIAPAADNSNSQKSNLQMEPHKTKTVQARIAEPVNVLSSVSQRLMTNDFPQVGEKPRLPASNKSNTKRLRVKMPAWIVHSIVSPQIRLWILAGFATVFVGLVFGRWAAGTLHKARLATKPVATAQFSAATEKASDGSSSSEILTLEQENLTPDGSNVTTAITSSDAQASGTDLNVQNKNADAMKVIAVAASASAAAPVDAGRSIASDNDNPLYMASAPGAAFEQILEVKVSGDVDIKLTIDGKKLERNRFTPDSYRFTFNDRAEIYLGDASMVDVIYNGKSLGILGNKGRKRRIHLQAKASLEDFPQ